MAARKDSATVDLKVRMKEPLRRDIERAAKRAGVSMNYEMVSRLDRSFREEAIVGGPVALALLAALNSRGAMVANSEGIENWPRDYRCYRSAAQGVVEALYYGLPQGDSHERKLFFHALRNTLETLWLREQEDQGNE